jgi:GNAT superfamily N-acetyltransferase
MGSKIMITFKQFIGEAEFDLASLRHKYSNKDSNHRIDVFNDSGAVGYIEWNENDGEIEHLFVGGPYRRKGVATRLWELATDWAKGNDAVEPEHSSRRSREGDAWAKSIGGYIPRITDDVDGWTSE